MIFWIVATVLTLVVTAALVAPLLRAGGEAAEDPATAIYRDQLAEVDRDLARGMLAPDEAERARTEIARRLLEADRTRKGGIGAAPRKASIVVGGIAALVVVAGGLFLYDRLGAPGYPDIPRAQRIADSEAFRNSRMSQATAEDIAAPGIATVNVDDLPERSRDLIIQLREIVPTRPDELQGWQLLAQHEAQLGNFAAAARAQERVIALKGENATLADRAALADRLVSAAGGFVSPETERLLRDILEQDEGNAAARYYLGLLYYQTDRPDVAFRFWRELAEQGSDQSPHVRLARAGVEDAAFRAGIEYSLQPTAPAAGPSADDVAAMADLSEEDRAAMIEGMVARLADRLAREGGPVEEWARLINALAVLGDTDSATEILREALMTFSADPAASQLLTRTAEEAGLTP